AGGALACLGGGGGHRAGVLGRCARAAGMEPFGRLGEQVRTTEPYASARGVFWVVDNGGSHRGERAARRLRDRWPNAVLVSLPVHASWLNERSTSQSSNASSSPPTTWPRWSPACSPSNAATSRPPIRSSGRSPAAIWPSSCVD